MARQPDMNFDDHDLEKVLRDGLAAFDSAPEQYSDFAKLAFEFRDLPCAEFIEADASFAGSRNVSTGQSASPVKFGDSELIWNFAEDTLIGAVAPGRSVRIVLVDVDGPVAECDSDDDGTFLFRDIAFGVRRLIVEDDTPWTTPWFRIPTA